MADDRAHGFDDFPAEDQLAPLPLTVFAIHDPDAQPAARPSAPGQPQPHATDKSNEDAMFFKPSKRAVTFGEDTARSRTRPSYVAPPSARSSVSLQSLSGAEQELAVLETSLQDLGDLLVPTRDAESDSAPKLLPMTLRKARRKSKREVLKHHTSTSTAILQYQSENQVAPLESVAFNEPTRQQRARSRRENQRMNLVAWKLWIFDLKAKYVLWRNKRRDPIPLWNQVLKEMEGDFGSGVAAFFAFTRFIFLLNLFQSCMYLGFIMIPTAIDKTFEFEESFTFSNLFDGRGRVGELVFFFGNFPPKVLDYRMDRGYLAILLFLFIFCFFFCLHIIAVSYRQADGSTIRSDERYPMAATALTSWDFSTHSSLGIRSLQKAISSAFRDRLHDLVEDDERLEKRILLRRALAWFIWFGLMVAAFMAIFSLLESRDYQSSSFWNVYGVPIVIAIINFVFPELIKRLVLIEVYHTRKQEIAISIGRIFVMYMLNIYAVVYGISKAVDLRSESDAGGGTVVDCAGTAIGEQFYKLVVVDTIAQVISRFAGHYGKLKIYPKRKIELDMMDAVLGISYRQGLVWAGMGFAPILPVIALLSNIIYFYTYVHLVRRTCVPYARRWNQSRNNTLFMASLAITLLLVVIPVSYVLRLYKPACGPYEGASYSYIYGVVADTIDAQSDGVQGIVQVLVDPSFWIPVGTLLVTMIYYLLQRVAQLKHQNAAVDQERAQLRSALTHLGDLLRERRGAPAVDEGGKPSRGHFD
eukprot:m.214153 g.214153  ORF g.214153 m.214153 type:complete len:756 (+) comp54050_c0_seq19:84-2351(+)